MFFILTTGRSGSTSIARTLNKVDKCYGIHEPTPELILESSGYHYGKISPESIRKLLHETRCPTINSEIYCESNQTLSLIIPELVAVFPQARFIWLVRNGLDVVASAYQKQWYSGHSENHSTYEACPPLEKVWIDGRVRADLAGDMSEVKWHALNRFEKCCWYWSYINRIIEKDLNRHAADRFFTLRLEDMPHTMPELLSWMGLTTTAGNKLPPVERANIAKRIPFHWTNWSLEQHQAFGRYCGTEMDKFYPSWMDVTGETGRLLMAPIIFNLTQMIKEQQSKAENIQSELTAIRNNRFWKIAQHCMHPFFRRDAT
ncbi:MAG: hypothetical protein D3923_01250 [Candidatus Electrothrix sp. AR3]|nr:hypothetical protein [Candidatus Electrothrix sp. AR3]